MLQIQPTGANEEPCPFSVDDLRNASTHGYWGYCQMWPVFLWEVIDPDLPALEERWIAGRLSDVRQRWHRETSRPDSQWARMADNKETFLIEVKGEPFYIMFMDHCVLIGRDARHTDSGY